MNLFSFFIFLLINKTLQQRAGSPPPLPPQSVSRPRIRPRVRDTDATGIEWRLRPTIYP